MRSRIKKVLIFGIIFSILLSGYHPMKVLAATPVASIGTKKYTSLEKAVSKVKDGETIKILNNISTPYTIFNARKVGFKIDLNKKTITYTGKNELFYLYRGTVTIQNGTIKAGKYEVADIGKKAKLTIQSGTYTGSFTNSGKLTIQNGKFSATKSSIVASEGICVIKAGTFESTSDSKVMLANDGKNAKMTIQGGSFLTTNSTLVKNIKGTVTIKGGTYKEKWKEKNAGNHLLWQVSGTTNIYAGTFVSAAGYCMKQDAGTVNIKGGTFSTEFVTEEGLGGVVKMYGGKMNITAGILRSNKSWVIDIWNNNPCTINVSGGEIYSFNTQYRSWYIIRNGFNKNVTVNVKGGTFSDSGK